jgi:hypothetical protein
MEKNAHGSNSLASESSVRDTILTDKLRRMAGPFRTLTHTKRDFFCRFGEQ